MARPDPYDAHPAYVAQAFPAVEPWRMIVGVLAFELAFFGLPVILALLGVTSDQMNTLLLGATPLTLFLTLASLGLPVLALGYAVRRVHHRGLATLIGPPEQALRQFAKVAWLVALVLLVQIVLTSGVDPDQVARRRPLPGWILMLPLAFLAVLIQTSAEELLYRGYLQQQLGALSGNPWVWMVIPSAIFALSHVFNATTLPDAIFYVGWTFAFGCIAADLTARAGTLGPAIALHCLFNFMQLVFFGLDGGPLSGFALVLLDWDGGPVTYLTDDCPLCNLFLLLVMSLSLYVLWLTARLAIRR